MSHKNLIFIYLFHECSDTFPTTYKHITHVIQYINKMLQVVVACAGCLTGELHQILFLVCKLVLVLD